MTLDLVKVAEQLPLLVDRAQQERELGRLRLQRAVGRLHEAAADPDAFAARVEGADTAWPLALPYRERPDAAFAPPDPPEAFAALAVDGSTIDVDRHLPVDCYVMNFGWMALNYGSRPAASRGSRVELQPTGEALVLRDAEDPSREAAVMGTVLGVVRGVRELAQLADLAEQYAEPGEPMLALVDGNLALWNLDKPDLPRTIAEELKYGERGTIQALDRLKALADAGRVVFSGFVSRSGAANLANSLRLLECPLQPAVACRACPGKGGDARPCDDAGLARDGELFERLLLPWQRSAVFRAHSVRHGRSAESWYTDAGHEIVFFYLRVEDEIARVELPIWMADDPARLALLHALLVQQAQEGGDYPLALQEAHEQAVISTGDRTNFTALLQRECEQKGIAWRTSAKAATKRMRRI